MSKASSAKSDALLHKNQNETTNVRRGSNRSKSIDSARLRRCENNHRQKVNIEPKSLEDYGYYFENGKLLSIENGRPFEFNVYTNKEDNNKRYHAIGRLVDDYIYDLMEKDLGLRRIPIPVDAKTSEPTGFVFVSDDLRDANYLMIIIHGMGVVRAGQWSRKLIINESIDIGSQMNYIQNARANGYAVLVTNTNLNTDESSKSILHSSRPIRGSGCAEEHARYVWENFIRQSPAYICIMAHSYGGAVVLDLAERYISEFDRRVFAVALSDSPMTAYTKHFSSNVLRILQKRTINWIADTNPVDTQLITRQCGQLRSAGHVLHEWTSYTAFRAIFKFFEEERKKLEQSKH